MRRTILLAIVAAVCGMASAVSRPLVSQPTPPDKSPHAACAARPHAQTKTASTAPVDIIDATSLGSPLLLDKGWRVGITADLQAANPGFDDSNWAIREAQATMHDVDEPGDEPDTSPGHVHVQSSYNQDQIDSRHRYAWFRLHLQLAPDHGPIALLVELPVSQSTTLGVSQAGPSVEIFANGRQIQPQGPHGDAPQHYQQISRLYNLNVPASESSLVLVARTVYVPFGFGAYTSFFADRTLTLGRPSDLQPILDLWLTNALLQRLPRLVYSVLLTVLALFLLALFIAQKGHPEYLWLALHELVQAPIGFVEQGGSSAQLDRLWYAAIVMQLVVVSAYLFFEFLVAFLSLPRRWNIRLLRYTSAILAGVGPALLMAVGNRGGGSVAFMIIVFLCTALWMLGWVIFIFGTLISATLRRNFEAGLLLIPLLLGLVGTIEPTVVASMSSMTGHEYRSPLTYMAGPIPISLASIANFTGILVILLIIFGRFLRIQSERERATSDLEAARSVQELMIPREKLVTPGFEVESIYNPANEVGGDFFHVQTAADGGMLVVIGDVAGKGLKAAMTVSMLMGALRATKERSPAKILVALNGAISGTDSFTTCQAVWFGANGEVVLANAGHLPPYLNSQEIALPGGLPLGVIPGRQLRGGCALPAPRRPASAALRWSGRGPQLRGRNLRLRPRPQSQQPECLLYRRRRQNLWAGRRHYGADG